MQIGMKLESDYPRTEIYRQLFEGLADPLATIRELGMQFIELPLGTGWDIAYFRKLIQANLAHGLRTNLHPYTRAEENPVCFRDEPGNACRENLLRALTLCDETARAQKATCVFVLHAAENYTTQEFVPEKAARAYYVERSRECFAWLEKTVRERGHDVTVVSEFQLPAKESEPGRWRIGQTFPELQATVEGTSLGLCWDTGHAFFSVERCGEPFLPPKQWRGRIRHVHLHDVADGKDHRPPLYDSVPVEDGLRAVREAGFDGDINLELNPRLTAEAGAFRDVMSRSIQRVRDAWATAS